MVECENGKSDNYAIHSVVHSNRVSGVCRFIEDLDEATKNKNTDYNREKQLKHFVILNFCGIYSLNILVFLNLMMVLILNLRKNLTIQQISEMNYIIGSKDKIA